MGPYDGACALAVDVQIPDVKLVFGELDFLPRTGVKRAREPELGIVRNF